MTERIHPDSEPTAALVAALARPDVWVEPDPATEDAVVARIAAEIATDPAPAAPVGGERPRPAWAHRAGAVLAAAAVVAVIVAGVVLGGRETGGGRVFALAGTDAQPGATAEAEITATPAGLKILLTTAGLPGAPDGFMYEAWVADGDLRVSAGTFHLRGGDGTIELWAGVVDRRFERLTVTLEPVDGDTASSGDVRLRGAILLDG